MTPPPEDRRSASRRPPTPPWRALALAALALALASLAVAVWALRELKRSAVAIEVPAPRPAPEAPAEDRLILSADAWKNLAGWNQDRHAEALVALLASCRGQPREDAGGNLGRELGRAAEAWRVLCARATVVPPGDDAAARAFLTESFDLFSLSNNAQREGLLTGYYVPELRGARRKKAPFVHPLYLAPRDVQVVDLGDFKRELAGRKISGMVRGGRFRPYWDRGEIEGGALSGKGLEMLWVDDPVALFFLQIQGSGRVRLADGTLVRVGYAAQNGHDYTAIGRILIDAGELDRESVSLQTIRQWLRAHPARAAEVMNQNRSYVFFRVLPGEAVGASGVELTPGRSLAVDPRFLPYGLPIWIDSTLPAAPELGRSSEAPLRRLVVAQDTGGAIRGPLRGDLFWGPGAEAEALAGGMKQPVRLWLLWPRGVALPPG